MFPAMRNAEISRIATIMGSCCGVCTMIRTMAPTQVIGAFIMIRIQPFRKFWICVTSLVILVMMEEGCSRSIFSKDRVCTFS